ncbi:MAG: hypothetical protein AMS14_08055 [Planctomycetes bacterium DG_20]|nr:MAG: hypothetical protein AMS14_08055 [Planctomycetes bacterium DG_20]
MSESDDDIRKVLRDTEPSDLDEIDRGLEVREWMVHGFRGKMRWATLVLWVYAVAGGVLAAVAAWQFWSADQVWDMALYATLFLVGTGLVAFMKLWYWQILNRNNVLREIKRLELRIAELADKGE